MWCKFKILNQTVCSKYIQYGIPNVETTTIVLRPFSLLRQGVGRRLPTTFHVPEHPPFSNHALSCPSLLHDSTPSSAFLSLSHLIRHAFLHPVSIIFPKHISQPSQPVPLHNVRHQFNSHSLPKLRTPHVENIPQLKHRHLPLSPWQYVWDKYFSKIIRARIHDERSFYKIII